MAAHRLIDPDITRLALCKVGANRQRVFLLKEDGESDKPVAAFARLVKGADDWSVAYVPVAVPGAEEGQGMFPTGDGDVDVWDEDQIVKAAHSFLKNGAEVVSQHFDAGPAAGAHLVESTVALADLDVNGTRIAKGTWYVGLEFDPELRPLVANGEIDAVSVEGFATRVAKDAAIVHDGTFSDVAQNPDAVNLDRFWDPMHPDLVECMVWCEGRMWAQDGQPPPPAPAPQMAKIERLVKDAILVPNKPGVTNWVERAGGLPKFIADIAGDLMTERGKTTGQAIELAVGIARNWCHGHGNVKADTRAKACAAASEWEAKKGAAHAMAKDGDTLGDVEESDRNLLQRLAKAVGIPTEADTCDLCGEIHVVGDVEDTPEAIAKATLSAASRKKLPKAAFAIPEKAPGPGSYPIHDAGHAANALSRAKGKGVESRVRSAVCKRHPNLPACKQMAKDGVLLEDSGSLGDVELGERVESLESGLADLQKKLIGTDDEPGIVAKIATDIEKLAKETPEPKPDEGNGDGENGNGDEPAKKDRVAKTRKDLDEAIEKVAEEFAGKLEPLAKRMEELEAGESAQQETNDKGEPVAKSEPATAGILFP